MNSPCPYICNNKTEYGYCKTTGCINSKMNTVEVGFTTNDKEFNAFLKGVEAGRRDALEGLVRCKDCKYFEEIMTARYRDGTTKEVQFCKKYVPLKDENFYCGWGKPKDEVKK